MQMPLEHLTTLTFAYLPDHIPCKKPSQLTLNILNSFLRLFTFVEDLSYACRHKRGTATENRCGIREERVCGGDVSNEAWSREEVQPCSGGGGAGERVCVWDEEQLEVVDAWEVGATASVKR